MELNTEQKNTSIFVKVNSDNKKEREADKIICKV